MSSLQGPFVYSGIFLKWVSLFQQGMLLDIGSRATILRAHRELMVRKESPAVRTEHHLCSCSWSGKVHPGDRSKTVMWTVGVLWLPWTALGAPELPLGRRDRLGPGDISSLHTSDSSVNAEDGGTAAAAAFLFCGSLLLWYWLVGPFGQPG